MKGKKCLVAVAVLSGFSFLALPTNARADLEETYSDKIPYEEYEALKEKPASKDDDSYYFVDDEVNFPKNEKNVRDDDGTNKFNRATSTDRDTFGEDQNVNNLEPEVVKKLEETNGEYGAKEGKYTANNLKENLDNIKDVVVSPGSDESQIGITRFAKGDLQKSFVVFDGKQYEASGSKSGDNAGYYSYKALVTGIVPGKNYLYYVQTGQHTSQIYSLKTKDFGKDNSFSVAYMGDPQIGSGDSVWDSKGLHKHSQGKVDQDKADFKKILTKIKKEDPNFYFSLGDNVEEASLEGEYDAFLDNDVFNNRIFSSVVGNHETYIDKNDKLKQNTVFKDHFYLANEDRLGAIVDVSEDNNLIYIPGDYRYTYGDTLFLNLNSNEINSSIHEAFIKKAIKEAKAKRGSNFSWIVVSFHHSPYSTATHSADDDIIQRRKEMVKIFNDNNVDLVINGHDHIYSRSYPMLSGENPMSFKEAFGTDIDNPSAQVKNGFSKTYNEKIYGKDTVIVDGIPLKQGGNNLVNPRGTIFLTISDASGSKYYNPISEDDRYVARSLDDRSQLFSVIKYSKHELQLQTKNLEGKVVDSLMIRKTDDAIANGIDLVYAKDKSALRKAYENAKPLYKKVEASELPAYMEAIKQAKNVLDDKLATQEKVDCARLALATKIDDLKLEDTASESKKETKTDKNSQKEEKKDEKAGKTEDKKVSDKKASKSSNPKTGSTGSAGILFLLTSAFAGFCKLKKRD